VTGPKTNEREGTRAFLRGAPISAYKVREVLDLIRNQPVERATEILRFCERGAAETVGKVLASAVANASENDDLKNPEELFVSACFADEGKTMRRMRPRARGRASRIRKRSAHITVIVARMPEDQLRRVRARQEAEQAARRARRAASRAGGERARRRQAAVPEPEPLEVAETSLADAAMADEVVAEAALSGEAPTEEIELAEQAAVEVDTADEAAAGPEGADTDTADEAAGTEGADTDTAATTEAADTEAADTEAADTEAAADDPENDAAPQPPKEEG